MSATSQRLDMVKLRDEIFDDIALYEGEHDHRPPTLIELPVVDWITMGWPTHILGIPVRKIKSHGRHRLI